MKTHAKITMKTDEYIKTDFSRKPMEIAASFWEDERYDDGKICYQSLRIIDDLIDNWKSTNQGMSKVEKQKFIEIVNNWTEAINYKKPRNSIQKQLIDIIN